jgi:dihydrofolate reductase
MSKLVFNISVSLDGYLTGPHQTVKEPLGENGEFLHEWAFNGGPENAAHFQELLGSAGAIICGRKTYDDSLPYWDTNGPTPNGLPLFVVTHRPLADSNKGGAYNAASSIPDAIGKAKAAAGGKDVSLMGGGNLARQAIAQGLVDEIELHIVPVLFGGGTRLFETLPNEVRLEATTMVDTPLARHVGYRVVH